MGQAPAIVWFRQDLRLADQAALAAAADAGPVIPVYVLDDETPGEWRIGDAQRWWLHHSLAALDEALRAKGTRLVLRRGRAADVLARLAEETGATAIHTLAHAEPWWREAEAEIAGRTRLELHAGAYLAPLGSVTTGTGGLYKVYGPFQRALWQRMPPPEPLPAPERLAAPSHWPKSDKLADWSLLPTRPDWAARFGEMWTPGEAGAQERLAEAAGIAADYEATRNLPSLEGSTRLSPHLHFGELSPAAAWYQATSEVLRRELAWRDFAANATLGQPDIGTRNGRSRVVRWRTGRAAQADLRAWQQGRTGYPIVDAGMRQLWATGWMHNRVRMIAASFLVKHLLIDWREGARWLWDTLVDADYGNNSLNWQWVAGTGVDSSPFSRIMAPLAQSRKFDAADYIRRWVPELASLDDAAIHDPHEAGVAPSDYPSKLIEHSAARERALAAARP